jgi:hypothetical protein
MNNFFIKNQTEVMCIIATKQNGLDLEFIRAQTMENGNMYRSN